MLTHFTKNLLLSLALLAACQASEKSRQEKMLIAFGSCAHSFEPMPILNQVVKHHPDLWIWLGDIMYGDSHDMTVLKKKYDLQKNKPEYQALLKATPVIGVYDDHDYGTNDGGKYYSKKDSSKLLLLDFLDAPADDVRRSRPGAYADYDYQVGDRTVKVILLDTRYFRDTLYADTTGRQRYLPNPDGDVLGEAQWQWLEQTLRNNQADFIIIGSSIQLIPDEQGYEKWANFPAARQRFFKLLTETKPAPVLLISGDRHIAEVSKIDLPGLGFPLYEFTSSGLTHTWGRPGDEPNRYRVGKLMISKNFGLIEVDFSRGKPVVRLQARSETDSLMQQNEIVY